MKKIALIFIIIFWGLFVEWWYKKIFKKHTPVAKWIVKNLPIL